jgi:NAD+ kinase
MKKIGIICKPQASEGHELIRQLIAWLSDRQIEVVVESPVAKELQYPKHCSRNEIVNEVDLLIVLGGDGTIISIARLINETSGPILGVNLGWLGFLAAIKIEELFTTMERIVAGDYQIEARMMLHAKLFRRDELIADSNVLNDVVINKGALARMIDCETWIDRSYVSTFRADGIIIATPTGSTAYNLSAGGPIITPNLRCISIVPICPHTLTNRPIVIDDASEIRVVLGSKDSDVFLTLDGQVGFAMRTGDELRVNKAATEVKFITAPTTNYYEILRTKLKWGEI